MNERVEWLARLNHGVIISSQLARHEHAKIRPKPTSRLRCDQLQMLGAGGPRINDAEASFFIERTIPRHISERRQRHSRVSVVPGPLADGCSAAAFRRPSGRVRERRPARRDDRAGQYDDLGETNDLSAGRCRDPQVSPPPCVIELFDVADVLEAVGGETRAVSQGSNMRPARHSTDGRIAMSAGTARRIRTPALGTSTGPRMEIAIRNVLHRWNGRPDAVEQGSDDLVDVRFPAMHLRQQAELRVGDRRHVEDRRLPLEALAPRDPPQTDVGFAPASSRSRRIGSA